MLYIDAVSELLNIILSNVLVINGEQQTELSPPQVERDSDDISQSFTKFFGVEMSAGGHDFSVFLCTTNSQAKYLAAVSTNSCKILNP